MASTFDANFATYAATAATSRAAILSGTTTISNDEETAILDAAERLKEKGVDPVTLLNGAAVNHRDQSFAAIAIVKQNA